MSEQNSDLAEEAQAKNQDTIPGTNHATGELPVTEADFPESQPPLPEPEIREPDETEIRFQEAKTSLPLMDDDMSAWMEHSTPKELMVLPFDSVTHVSDQYELALISLYKRKWSFTKIVLMHFFLFAPSFELPWFGLPQMITKLTFIVRFVCIALANVTLFGLLYVGLFMTGYLDLFGMLSGILAASLLILHFILAWETFVPWKAAYSHIDHGYLESFLPPKKVKEKKKKKTKFKASAEKA